jgi:hypothetical protein
MISLPRITAEEFNGYLLGENAKLAKLNGREYLIRGLALAPHMRSGVNLCPEAGFFGTRPECHGESSAVHDWRPVRLPR